MRKILLVEDEDMLRESYDIILSTEPYQVDTASDGAQALEKCADQRYDLILLDLMMPIVDGVTFLEEYKKRNFPETKIILLSNLSSGSELSAALKLGANRNVLKAELSPKQLLATVRYELEA